MLKDEDDPMIRFARANQPKTKSRTKRNAKPEKDVEHVVLDWLRWNGFDINVVESKAVFNPAAGRYISSQAIPGMSDLVGNDKNGIACYIELKAVGRISTVSDKQVEFLKRKIATNCFACVVDGVDKLEKMYSMFNTITSLANKREYLLCNLERKPYGKEKSSKKEDSSEKTS